MHGSTYSEAPPSSLHPTTEVPTSRAATVLIAALAATALAITPYQLIYPDTAKLITASLLVLVAMLLWSVRFRTQAQVQWSGYLALPLALSAMALASTHWSDPYAAALEAWRWLLIGTAIFLGFNCLQRSHFTALSRTLLWSVLACSAVALAQFWVSLPWLPAVAEPGSTFGNRNFFAEFVAAAFPLTLALLFTQQTTRQSALSGLQLGIIALAILCTGSRAGIITILFCLLSFSALVFLNKNKNFIYNKRSNIAITTAVAGAIILTLGFIPSLNEKILEEKRGNSAIERTIHRLGSLGQESTYAADSSFGMRLVVWEASVDMIENHPLRGVGAGGWNMNLPLFMPSGFNSDVEYVLHAHNEPLQLIAEYGLLGWLALAALITLAASGGLAALRKMRSASLDAGTDGAQQATVVLALSAMALTSLSGLPLHAPAANLLMSILIALLLLYRSSAPDTANKPTPSAKASLLHNAPLGLSVLALGAALFLAVQWIKADHLFSTGLKSLAAAGAQQQRNPAAADALAQTGMLQIQQSLALNPNQSNMVSAAADRIGALGKHEAMIWFSDTMLQSRPHATALRCNKVIARIQLKDFETARSELSELEALGRQSPCVEFAKFAYLARSGDRPGSLLHGLRLLDEKKIKEDASLRYIVESSYQTAFQLSDYPSAIKLLKIRGEKWPSLKSHSQLMAGIAHAQMSPHGLSPEALQAFREAARIARPADRRGILAHIPEIYKRELKLLP